MTKEKKLFIRFEDLVEPTVSAGEDPITNVVMVNDDANPVTINNDHFTGQLTVRCHQFSGITPIDPEKGRPKSPIYDTDYFRGHKRLCSFQMTGRFKKEWNGDDIVFGCFFTKPIRPPKGHHVAIALARAIDKSLVFDIDREDPAMYSPLICTMTTFGLEKAVNGKQKGKDKPLPLPKWRYSGCNPKLEENIVRDYEWWRTQPKDSPNFYSNYNNSLENLRKSVKEPPCVWKPTYESCRRKWFYDEQKRKHFIFHPDRVYSFDMATPFLDLNEMKLRLGISFSIEPYIGDQAIRYQCRTRDGSTVFWTAEFGRKLI